MKEVQNNDYEKILNDVVVLTSKKDGKVFDVKINDKVIYGIKNFKVNFAHNGNDLETNEITITISNIKSLQVITEYF